MAKASLGNKGVESAVRSMPTEKAVLMLARSYDKLVRELEYTLSHLSEENLLPGMRTGNKEDS